MDNASNFEMDRLLRRVSEDKATSVVSNNVMLAVFLGSSEVSLRFTMFAIFLAILKLFVKLRI